MTSIAVFEKVAAGDYTAEQGAKLLLDGDRLGRQTAKPAWMPRVIWVVTLAGIACVLGLFGISRD